MHKAKLESLGSGRFRITGVLDASTATELLKQGHERFRGEPRVDVDLAGVSESDSAGLALLIEWLRMARLAGQHVHFTNMPAQINALARISEVDELLTANGFAATPN